MVLYNLSERVTAFTTTKRYGREAMSLCDALNVPIERFARPHQVHGVVVRTLSEEDFANPELLLPDSSLMEGVDAVIYNVRNACIGISTADCIPVVCYDPEHHCAAAIHAGWKGTVLRIVEHSLSEMQRVYGTDPTALKCAIGPGISFESFEVGDEVYDAFDSAGFDMSTLAQRFPCNSSDSNNAITEKWHINLKECNRQQLIKMGVKPENIEVSSIDTKTDERFYSARREGAKTGRILSGIVLR